ncbi:MAG: hypothetical protein QOC81_3330 [Thermoanaerobaculia bacterium]|jgi:hypothetical protein|nr:hypothetical protein [Thermoanaerobaculia bacterium]
MFQRFAKTAGTLAALLICTALPPSRLAAAEASRPSPIGIWRGTSTCTDLVAAPGCNDEIVVYELTPGSKSGMVHWKADKVVDGQRQPMGEMDLTYDTSEGCWRAEFQSPRMHSVWCLTVDGAHMTGTGRLLPGKQVIRKIDVRRSEGAAGTSG